MSGASDKARYHLEHSVPELQDLLRKKIFTKEEITSIARKRSDFEHILAARGSKPADYARYAEYEMNLDALRKKRMQRKGVKATGHSGQKKVFFILERGTRKFQGDLRLWMQYVEYARAQKARRKIKEVMTAMLRLHPTKAELWMYAARWSVEEEGDMMGARGYMQRGLRFCQNDRALWVEYAKLEVIYVAKIAGRRKILGLDGEKKELQDEDMGEDMMRLPDLTAEDINPSLTKDDSVDEIALQNLANTPALTGAIPIAIFDQAMKHFNEDEELAEQFFDMVAVFDQGTTTRKILQHIVDSLVQIKPDTVITITCQFSLPLVGLDPSSAEFPAALAESLETIRLGMKRLPLQKAQIADNAIYKLLPFASNRELDQDVQKVLIISVRKFIKEQGGGDASAKLVERLQVEKRPRDAHLLLDMALRQDSANERLLQLQASLTSVVAT
jgi:U3 small nucleolar RNA-associated protein 6